MNLFTKRAISSYEGVSSELSSSSYSSSSSSSSKSSSLALSARFEEGPPYVASSLLDSFMCSSYCKKVAITSSGVILKKSGIRLNSHTRIHHESIQHLVHKVTVGDLISIQRFLTCEGLDMSGENFETHMKLLGRLIFLHVKVVQIGR